MPVSDRVVVVGGGAAGLMAAGRAAELGADVVLLEKKRRVGSKLRITGKGRCNLTNRTDLHAFLGHLGSTGVFMRNAFSRFFVEDLIAFFEDHGVPTVTQRGQRVFPASEQAHDVVNALSRYCAHHGVTASTGRRVDGVLVRSGRVAGVRAGAGDIAAGAVVLATGGLSYPQTGSEGDGYRIARRLGHHVTPLRPGLVPLVLAEPFIARLQGLSLRNVRATLYAQGRALASEFGEMVFTNDGVSGPIVLTLSSVLGDTLNAGPARLVIDLKPALDEGQLDQRLLRDLAASHKAAYRALLNGLLPRSLIEVFAKRSGIALTQKLAHLTGEQRRRIVQLLKRFELTVTGTRPIAEAIITLGGVQCDEIVPQTMASRIVRGLYFAGEILDVAGDTGGYNLQVAFTTGRIAGESAAQVALGGDG